jgi:tetratricopeptide (TPR) repeat protein
VAFLGSSAFSPDGSLFAHREGNIVRLTETRLTDEERLDRLWWTRPRPDLHLEELDKAIKAKSKFAARFHLDRLLSMEDRQNAQSQRDLSIALSQFGDLELQNGDSKAALASYQRSLDLRERLVKADPRNVQDQRNLSMSLTKLGTVHLQSGDSPASLTYLHRARDCFERLIADKAALAGDFYNTACVFALCIPQTEEPDAKEKYAKRAVELLKQAAGKGYRNVAHMKKDTDLDALRQRDDFKQFIAELEGMAVPKKEPLRELLPAPLPIKDGKP